MQVNKKYILFDLDGTLINPEGLINAFIYALDKYDIKVDRSEAFFIVGIPIREAFQRCYNFSEDQADEAFLKHVRPYFDEKGKFEYTVYAGIEELLDSLKKADKTLIVATAKSTIFANQILEHSGLNKYFSYVLGGELDTKKIDKVKIIADILNECNISNLDEVIMVGDREIDIIAAKRNGISSLGVLYGYSEPNELKLAGADYIVESTEEIKKMLC